MTEDDFTRQVKTAMAAIGHVGGQIDDTYDDVLNPHRALGVPPESLAGLAAESAVEAMQQAAEFADRGVPKTQILAGVLAGNFEIAFLLGGFWMRERMLEGERTV